MSHDVITGHLRKTWSLNAFHELIFNAAPIRESLPDLRIVRIDPLSAKTRRWVYCTNGAWGVQSEPVRKEFFLLSPLNSDRLVTLLSMVANYHADPIRRLTVGDVINLGEPWLDSSACDHLLVSLPYPYGPALECLDTDDLKIRFLWLLPITKSERDYLDANGLEQLERLFDANCIDCLDLHRPPVA